MGATLAGSSDENLGLVSGMSAPFDCGLQFPSEHLLAVFDRLLFFVKNEIS